MIWPAEQQTQGTIDSGINSSYLLLVVLKNPMLKLCKSGRERGRTGRKQRERSQNFIVICSFKLAVVLFKLNYYCEVMYVI